MYANMFGMYVFLSLIYINVAWLTWRGILLKFYARQNYEFRLRIIDHPIRENSKCVLR